MKLEPLGLLLRCEPPSLERTRVIEYFEGDRLVEYRSENGEIFLQLWADERDDETRYFIFRCTTASYSRFLGYQLTLRDLLDHLPDGFLYVRDCSKRESRTSLLMLSDLPERYRPTESSYYDSDLTPKNGSPTECILLDGNWSVERLSFLDRRYRQVYAAQAAFSPHFKPASYVEKSLHRYHFEGGWVYVKAFNLLVDAIPANENARVRAFQYASPGVLEYSVEPLTADRVSTALRTYLDNRSEIHPLYLELHKQLVALGKELKDAKEPNESDVRSLEEPSLKLAQALGIKDPKALLRLTNNNVLNASHILASYYRRLQDLADVHETQDAKISSVLRPPEDPH